MSVGEAKKKTAKAVFLRLACASSIEGLQSRLCATQNEGVNIVCAFVGVDGFQVDHVANDMVFVVNAIAAVHVARHAGHVQGFAATVALDQADHLGH